MAQQSQADWVNFGEIKAKVRFEQVLRHFELTHLLEREGEEVSGACPLCQDQGFKVNLARGSFSCPGCKKRGSVIDFTSAYKKVGLKEAGKLLKEIMEASARSQVKEAPEPGRRSKKRKGRGSKESTPASLAEAVREEIAATARALDAKLKEAQGLAQELMANLERLA